MMIIKKMLLIILMTLCLVSIAKAEEDSISILAGMGLNHPIDGYQYTSNSAGNGFMMGFEYAHKFSPTTPFFLSGSLYTSELALIGAGIDIGLLRFEAKGGVGITGDVTYGWLYGGGAEIKMTQTFGVKAEAISNKSYLVGLSFHW